MHRIFKRASPALRLNVFTTITNRLTRYLNVSVHYLPSLHVSHILKHTDRNKIDQTIL